MIRKSGYRFSEEILRKLKISALEGEPGNPVPIDPLPLKMRQVDREWFPICIAPVMVTRITPMAARRGLGCGWLFGCFSGLRRNRGPRHACGRLGGGRC